MVSGTCQSKDLQTDSVRILKEQSARLRSFGMRHNPVIDERGIQCFELLGSFLNLLNRSNLK